MKDDARMRGAGADHATRVTPGDAGLVHDVAARDAPGWYAQTDSGLFVSGLNRHRRCLGSDGGSQSATAAAADLTALAAG